MAESRSGQSAEKFALVTGGAVRLGRAIALHLAGRGWNVAIHFHKSMEDAEKTAAEIRELGRRSLLIEADFCDPAGPKKVADKLAAEFGALDLLVNSAGIWPQPEKISADRSIETEDLAGWDSALSIGARAPFFLIQSLAPLLTQASSRTGAAGQVINILDRSISVPFIDRAAHSVAKSALAGLTHLAAKTYAGRFRVNGLELGSVLPQEAMDQSEKSKKKWLGIGPMVQALDRVIENGGLNGSIERVV